MSHTSDDPPRLLAIMGSGETAPTMAKVHRLLLGRSGPQPVPAVMLDTPYGFQENADEITARALEYFRENVGMPMTLAPFRTAEGDPVERATALARLLTQCGTPTPNGNMHWTHTTVTRVLARTSIR